MKRLLSALILVGVSVCLGGCETPEYVEGRGTLIISRRAPPGVPQQHCGVQEFGGIVYDLWCRQDGSIILIPRTPAGSNRLVPTRPVEQLTPLGSTDGQPALPENSATFEFGGATHAFMQLPDELMDDGFAGTADELLDTHDVVLKGERLFTTFQWSYDSTVDEADVRFAFTTGADRPDTFDYDLRYETVVVHGANEGDPGFVYQRIVGPLDEVMSYLEDLGGDELMDQISEMLVNVFSTSE